MRVFEDGVNEPMIDRQTRYLTIQEVADRLRVSRSTVERRIRQGLLPSIRIGNLTRVPDTGLVQYERSLLGKA
jgi:excisionase family DNA binding protein